MDSDQFDILAVGDTATDTFIKLKTANVVDTEDGSTISMPFREKVPYEFAIVVPGVGNSANAAVSAARLGLKSALLTNVGKDRVGDEMVASLKKNGVSEKFITQQEGKVSGEHYVLWFKEDRTILINHQSYDYSLPDIGLPKWIYLSSVTENSIPFQVELADYILANPSIKLAFQPGTFQIRAGKEIFKKIYLATEAFFCNKEEAQKVLSVDDEDVSHLLDLMHSIGPKIVIISDGPRGAYLSNNGKKYFMPIYPDPKPPYERTGAGDAFASTFTAVLAMGKSPEEAMQIAPINSMSVVQFVGAQEGLLTMAKVEEYLAKAPEDYKLREI